MDVSQKVLLLMLILLCSALAWPLRSLAQDQGEEEAAVGFKVEQITVEGNKHVPLEEIKKAIGFKVGDHVTEEEIKASGQRVLDLGYFQEVIPDYRKVNEGIEVLYLVQENPLIKEIVIRGNEQYGEGLNLFGLKIPFTSPILKTDRILEILEEHGVAEKKVLNLKKLEEGLRAVLGEYQNKGYTLVSVGDVKLGERLEIELIEAKIERIEITGVDQQLGEIAQGLIKVPLGKPVKIEALQASLQRLNNSIYFERTGAADISFSQGSAPDKLIMTWNLRERTLLESPIVLKGIEFSGATVYKPEQLAGALGPLPQGQGEVDNFQLLQALQGVYDLYHQNGYTMMGLANGGLAEGVLTIAISEGVINEIAIQGNKRTKEYVIRRKLLFKPGDIFNEGPLRESYRRLQQLGYFQSIDLSFEEAGPGRINLILIVAEKENLGSFSGALSFAGGALVGKLSLSWKNMFGTGQDLSLGYDRTLLEKAEANWHLDYTTTTFFPNYDFFKASLYQESEEGKEADGREYTLNKRGVEASLGYPLGRGSQLTLGQRYESSNKCFKDTIDCTAPETTSSVTLGLSNDDRNSVDFPTSGGFKSLSLEQAGAFTAGPRFMKLAFTLIQHFPTLRDQNIALRLYGGQGFSLPSDARFSLGGSATLRGIPSFKAEKFFLVNTEYRAVLTEGAVGVAFVDLGIAEGTGLQRSFGLELRAQLPAVGPVRLIFSWPVIAGEISWQPKIDFAFGTMF
ncbi:MAG: BamA/OMP85 family outer membrane protein [Candidatus Bipolaricaulia bacterium]